jgi:hypothetical protein
VLRASSDAVGARSKGEATFSPRHDPHVDNSTDDLERWPSRRRDVSLPIRRDWVPVMGARPSPWLWLWLISFPLMTAGVAYALGGLGTGIFDLVIVSIVTVATARFQLRRGMPGTHPATPTSAQPAPLVLFRRSWLLVIVAVALALPIVVASTGISTATVVIACCALVILVSGAVALAVMSRAGGDA